MCVCVYLFVSRLELFEEKGSTGVEAIMRLLCCAHDTMSLGVIGLLVTSLRSLFPFNGNFA